MRILVVEDEIKTAQFLKKGLAEHNYNVDVCADGEQGLEFALTNVYDLIILDIMLPKRDGRAVITAIRRSGLKTPIMFLTARDSVADRVEGLELGADDYLIKPFSFSELIARLRIILRRGPAVDLNFFQIGDLKIDLVHHKVMRDGKRIELTPKEFTILALLARRPGQILTRAVIADQVWNMNFDSGTNFVDVHIRRLRSKIDDPFEKKLIRTIRGVGYVIDDINE